MYQFKTIFKAVVNKCGRIRGYTSLFEDIINLRYLKFRIKREIIHAYLIYGKL